MAVSYKKLWHILVDRKMKKKDLEEAAHISHYQMYKLANDKDINRRDRCDLYRSGRRAKRYYGFHTR